MPDPFIGEVILFAGNFAPRGWAFCEGQLLSISSNQALFSILGTTYGGDGRSTFALPDLRGRVPIQQGHGAGLSQHNLGSKGGGETVTLTKNQLASHNHTLGCHVGKVADAETPANNTLGKENVGKAEIYSTVDPDATMRSTSIGETGGNEAHNNMQPFLALNYIIALQGVFPSRN